MSDPNTDDSGAGNAATAVAAPPAPPAEPPLRAAATPDGEPGRMPRGVVVAIVTAVIALLFLGVVVWLVFAVRSSSGPKSGAGSPAAVSAFESAMHKAGVKASYPSKAPVELTLVTPTGSHPFSATFTADEIAALIDTFSYTADTAGMQIAITRANMSFPAPGTVKLDAQVTANGGTYSGSLSAPVTFEGGQVIIRGVSDLTVEGISANAAQKGQVRDALTTYANSLLSAAPGLTVDTASIQADGLHASGTAPDSLSYP